MPPSNSRINQCSCGICRLEIEHPEQVFHYHINLLMSNLNEKQRRWLAAVLAEKYGMELRGIYIMTQITGLNEKTIRKGLKDLESGLIDMRFERVRKPGAGRISKGHDI